jgi:ribonuclease VapC
MSARESDSSAARWHHARRQAEVTPDSTALNYGDCFAYALAKAMNASLLCKGNDFPLTDISIAYN